MTRRQHLAALFAPFIARFLPKLKPTQPESLKISVRVWRTYDVRSDEIITHLDVLYGFYGQHKVQLSE